VRRRCHSEWVDALSLADRSKPDEKADCYRLDCRHHISGSRRWCGAVFLASLLHLSDAAHAQLVAVRVSGFRPVTPAEILDEPAAAAVGPNNSLFLVDRHETGAVVLDSSGLMIRRLGRKGEGPGEFTRPCCVGVIGDVVWIADPQARRITSFSGTRVLSTVSLATTDEGTGLEPISLFADGTLAAMPVRIRSNQPIMTTSTLKLMRIARDGSDRGVMLALSHPNRTKELRWGRGRAFVPSAFDDRPKIATHSSGVAVVVEQNLDSVARSARVVVRIVDTAGRTISRRDLRIVPRPVTKEEVNADVRGEGESFKEFFGSADRAAEAYRKDLWIPAVHPPVRKVLFGADRSVWIALTTSSEDEEWWTDLGSSRSGSSFRRVMLPKGERVLAANASSVWTWVTAEDAGEVRRYSLRGEARLK
jgi:hypothetical protein